MKSPILLATGVALLASISLRADTPDAIGNPEALRKSVPTLAGQKLWTSFATREQIKLFDGPATQWPVVPNAAYDLSSFDPVLLGGKVPPPGVHPRILFSPEDVPAIAQRLKAGINGRKVLLETECVLSRTIWNADSDEGRIFAKLASGDLKRLEWPDSEGKEPGFKNAHYFKGFKMQLATSTHSGYLPRLLNSAAFLCLLNNDEARGKQVAAAMANYYKLREPLIDRLNTAYDSKKIMPNDEWRPMHQLVGNNNLGFGYDVAAKWMTDDQKALMRRIIGKATRGKRGYGMNGPTRWRDTNWVGWDLEFFLTALAIEGEEGYDPAIYPAAKETARAYLDWGISPSGTIFETNGKNGAGLLFELDSLTALARRGENFFGHPHLRKLTAMQAQAVVPSGEANLNNGTWGCAGFWGVTASILKGFYPKDACADWLLRLAEPDLRTLDLEKYARQVADPAAKPPVQWTRFEILTPATVLTYQDWEGAKTASGTQAEAASRDHLLLPLTFLDSVHGLLQARSSNDKDALYLMFEARPDLRGVGHQHHDSGHFYLAALGELWAVEAGPKNSFSQDHNTIQIDGRGHSDVSAAPRVAWLRGAATENVAIASANLKNAYDYAWTTPMHFSWLMDENKKGLWKLSPDTDPDLVAYYKGTQNVKMRIWGESYWQNNWGPAMRIPGNPVLYAYRSAGIVRGKHPYAMVVDDINKDDKEHNYEWLMQMPDGVRLVNLPLRMPSVDAILLTRAAAPKGWSNTRPAEALPNGTPALIVCLLDPARGNMKKQDLTNVVNADNLPFRVEQLASDQGAGSAVVKTRLVIQERAVDPAYKVLLIPYPAGDEMPNITWDDGLGSVSIAWKNQKDECVFTKGTDKCTRITVKRDGVVLGEVK